MRTILLLTDTPARGERLARDLGSLGPCLVVDLLDPAEAGVRPEPTSIRAVVSDVMFTPSAPVAGLKRHLDRLGPKRPPFLCILHGDSPRATIQAEALGADGILRMDRSVRALGAALAPLLAAGAERPASLVEDVARVDGVLARIFDLGRTGGIIAPEAVSAGAELIHGALRRSDVRAWLDVVWRFDDATHQHCLLVAGLAAGFARHLGLRQADAEQLTQAALLHDIGKSRIPLAILNKPGPLDHAEMAVMRTHAVLGDEMLRGQGHGETMHAVVRSHHECLDGSGYPDALRGRAIPDLVRLVTVCDTFAALVERRPYRKPMEGGLAYATLTAMGGKLDQDLVRAFLPLAEIAGPTLRVPSS